MDTFKNFFQHVNQDFQINFYKTSRIAMWLWSYLLFIFNGMCLLSFIVVTLLIACIQTTTDVCAHHEKCQSFNVGCQILKFSPASWYNNSKVVSFSLRCRLHTYLTLNIFRFFVLPSSLKNNLLFLNKKHLESSHIFKMYTRSKIAYYIVYWNSS